MAFYIYDNENLFNTILHHHKSRVNLILKSYFFEKNRFECNLKF